MPNDSPKKASPAQKATTEKARELVRTIFVEDFHQKVSKKTINEVAAQITKVLPKKGA